ncbi:MAG: hypothetical protein ACTSYI_03080, partial [Promethearchaeota archaeon]
MENKKENPNTNQDPIWDEIRSNSKNSNIFLSGNIIGYGFNSITSEVIKDTSNLNYIIFEGINGKYEIE